MQVTDIGLDISTDELMKPAVPAEGRSARGSAKRGCQEETRRQRGVRQPHDPNLLKSVQDPCQGISTSSCGGWKAIWSVKACSSKLSMCQN